MAETKTDDLARKAEDAARTVEQNMQQGVEQIGAQATETMERAEKSVGPMADFGQNNLSAMVESSRRAHKAMESMSAEIVAFSKRTMQESVAATKDMASAKSFQELVEKQTAFQRQYLDSAMKEMSKLSEMVSDATRECAEPLTERVHASFDQAKEAQRASA